MFRVTNKKFELRAKTYDYGLKYPMKASDDLEEIKAAYSRFIAKGYFDICLLED
jgi:hypothetical protein